MMLKILLNYCKLFFNSSKQSRIFFKSSEKINSKRSSKKQALSDFLNCLKTNSIEKNCKDFQVEELKKFIDKFQLGDYENVLENLNNCGYLLKKSKSLYTLVLA